MKVTVVVTEDALRDLDDIHAFIAFQDGQTRADDVLDGISDVLSKLGDFPQRGEYPPELSALGLRQYRQVYHKPCRMIYQVATETAYVLAVCDGRRDMQTLLQRRLLG